MQRPTANDFDHASLEAMMERYRAELLRYQRATPPGKPTLAQNLETSEKGRMDRTSAVAEQKQAAPPKVEVRQPTTQTILENKKIIVQPEGRREKVMVETPPIMLLPTAQIPRPDAQVEIGEQAIEPSTQGEEDELQIFVEPLQPAEPPTLPELPTLQLPQPVDATSPGPPTSQLSQPVDATSPGPPTSQLSQPVDATSPGPPTSQLSQPVDAASPESPALQLPQPVDATSPEPLALQLPQPVDITSESAPMTNVMMTENITETQSVLPNVPQNSSEMLPQLKEDVAQAPAPTPQLAMDSNAEKKPQAIVTPSVATAPPSSMAIVLPEQQPEPIKNDRAFAPVKTQQPGCIAHTEFEKDAGAYGVFRPYERMGKYTLASFMQTPGEAVQTLVRFAADVPMGSADAIRCRRSFTVKFFCREGEYDLFGMHLPVSVGTTENTLTECCAASRANPKTGLRTRAAFWEFLVTHPEALHATMWLYSDLGTIGSYRTIDGYGLPCIWVNAKNERRAVRPRWLSRQRPQTLTRFESEELAGSDPDGVARDLSISLQAGERPQYELSIQVIEPEQFASLSFDPFDPTAIWPTEQFKLQRIGLLTLERLPDDVQTELNCARFQPENIIPGIEHVPAPAQKSGDDFTQVQQYLRSLGEFSRHRLIDNLTEELLRLPPLLLEQVLILFSRADLEFGQAVTLALGG